MRPKFTYCCVAAICFALSVVSLSVHAQDASPSSPALQDIESQRAAVVQNEALDETAKAQALALYDETLRQLRLAEEWRMKAADFDRQREESPTLTRQYEEELARPPREPELPSEKLTVTDLEPLLSDAENRYKEAQTEFDQLTTEPRRRGDRRREIPGLIATSEQHAQETKTQIDQSAAQGEASEIAAARRAAADARLQALGQERAALEKELLCYDARDSLLSLRQAMIQRDLAFAEKQVKILREATASRRSDEAEIAAEEARRTLESIADIDPAIRERAIEIARENAELAEQRTGADGITGKIESARDDLETAKSQVRSLEESFQAILSRVKVAGLSNAVSLQLRDLKRNLPSLRQISRQVHGVAEEITQSEIELQGFRDRQRAIATFEQDLDDDLRRLEISRTDYERNRIRQSFSELLQSQRSLFDALSRDYQTYLGVSFELSTELAKLENQAVQLTDYIDSNILWSRGVPAWQVSVLGDTAATVAVWGDPDTWAEILSLMRRDVEDNFALYTILCLVAFIALLIRGILRNRLRKLGQSATNKRETHFSQTVAALVLTTVLALMGPLFLAATAWRLSVAADAVELARAVSSGLLSTAWLYFALAASGHLLAREGLIECHFGFGARYVRSARRCITALLLTEVPAFLIIFICESQTVETWKESVGRFALAAGMVLLALFAGRLPSVIRRAMQDAGRTSWLSGHRWGRVVLFMLVSGVPLALATLAIYGFHYTALQLALRLFQTYLVLIAVFLVSALARRWLLVVRRRLAIEQARRRREALKSEGESPEALQQDEVDIVRVDAQSQTFIRVAAGFAVLFGGWFVWTDVIPALRVFDRFVLWETTDFIQETVPDPDGQTSTKLREVPVDITVSDLGLAVIIIALSVVAVRNLPGFLEMAYLKRLGAGERYATLAVIRYALVGIGGVAAFNAVGIGWGKIQWLVAALGVGLGFGLQEIFANFVSGLILLFERPIRVGDTVTLGGISGNVTRIQIRATTIMDWDRKELVVPNKEFVTGQLINWTLSDTVTRVVIPVGVAYGSDTDRVIATLLELAANHADIMKEPEPQALFLGFGDSSLNFELRSFCDTLEARLRITHDLHMAIDAAFRKAGIEIAFPQRDLHIRSGLDVLSARSNPATLAKIEEHEHADNEHAPEDERRR